MAGRSVFNTWFTSRRPADAHTLDEEQHGNPYRELSLLSGHKQPVYRVETLDCNRFISLSEDCTASVWNSEDGSHVLELEGHSAPIAAVLFFGRSETEDCQAIKAEEVIVTGSSDGVKFWSLLSLQSGGEEKTTIHPKFQVDGAVVCLERVGDSMFCSGGEYLCLWNCSTFELLCKFEKKVNIKGMLLLPKDDDWSIVALSEYSPKNTFDVWDMRIPDTQDEGNGESSKQQPSSTRSGKKSSDSLTISHVRAVKHQSSGISSLCRVSDLLFATVSPLAPAQVAVWSTKSITMVMKIDQPGSPKPPPKSPHAATSDPRRWITCIVPFKQRYLVVAMDNNVAVYDTSDRAPKDAMKPLLLTEIQQAHSHPINSACLIGNGHLLVTCSDDGRIRLWGISTGVNYEVPGCLFETVSQASASSGRRSARRQGLSLIGDLQWGHTQVKGVCSITSHSFVSNGSLEHEMILWKNHEIESRHHEEELAQFLLDRGQISLKA